MRIVSIACLSLLLATPVFAETIETAKIITALSGDFNGDGASDLALVVETEPSEPMDFHFFLRDKAHGFLRPTEVIRGKITGEWNGFDRPGYENSDTEPSLELLPNGSIRLHVPALPIGSQRTNETLTLAFRKDRLVVAGFAYDAEDFQLENSGERCQYNVLTGKGARKKQDQNGRWLEEPVTTEPGLIAFADWEFSMGASACGR